jgi:hypothetical protein
MPPIVSSVLSEEQLEQIRKNLAADKIRSAKKHKQACYIAVCD